MSTSNRSPPSDGHHVFNSTEWRAHSKWSSLFSSTKHELVPHISIKQTMISIHAQSHHSFEHSRSWSSLAASSRSYSQFIFTRSSLSSQHKPALCLCLKQIAIFEVSKAPGSDFSVPLHVEGIHLLQDEGDGVLADDANV